MVRIVRQSYATSGGWCYCHVSASMLAVRHHWWTRDTSTESACSKRVPKETIRVNELDMIESRPRIQEASGDEHGIDAAIQAPFIQETLLEFETNGEGVRNGNAEGRRLGGAARFFSLQGALWVLTLFYRRMSRTDGAYYSYTEAVRTL